MILEKYFLAKFVGKYLVLNFYAPPSAHKCNPYFGYLGGTYSLDDKSLDLNRRNIKFVFIFKLGMFTF